MSEQILKDILAVIDTEIVGSAVVMNVQEPKYEYDPKFLVYRNAHLAVIVFNDNDYVKVQFSRYLPPSDYDKRCWDQALSPLPTEFESSIAEMVFLKKGVLVGPRNERNEERGCILKDHADFLSFCEKIGITYNHDSYENERVVDITQAHEIIRYFVEQLKSGTIFALNKPT